jgi:hypothetical protein
MHRLEPMPLFFIIIIVITLCRG